MKNNIINIILLLNIMLSSRLQYIINRKFVRFNSYTINELTNMGVNILGTNINVSKCVNIYTPSNLYLHNNVRIDDYSIISCNGIVELHDFVHISSGCLVMCAHNSKIIMNKFAGISSGVKLFGSTGDYMGNALANPTVPLKYNKTRCGDIIMEEHSVIGANSVVLPNVILRQGTSIGSLSMVTKSTESWKIYAGNPLKLIKNRNNACIMMGKLCENEIIKV